MIANISGIFALGYFSFSPDVVCIQTPHWLSGRLEWQRKKTEQKPSLKSVLSRAEFERLEVENFCRNLHIAQVVLFR